MTQLSANLSLLFTENEFIDRFKEAKNNGFDAVEFQFPYDIEAQTIKKEIDKNKLILTIFNSPPGDFENGDRGLACLEKRKDDFKKSIIEAISYAKIFQCNKIHVMSGVSEKENVLNAKKVYIENLKWACDEFDKHNINLLIEPINQRNIPNYFLSSTDQAIEIIDKIERDNIYLLFDIYHHQIIRGDVSKYFEKFQAYIGHIQIAGIPNRNEPDQSELDYKYVFKLIERLNYTGFIGCEYKISKNTNFREFKVGEEINLKNNIKCKTMSLPHPGLNTAFRMYSNDFDFVYASDVEAEQATTIDDIACSQQILNIYLLTALIQTKSFKKEWDGGI